MSKRLSSGPTISVVVPVFNGAPQLEELANRLQAVLDRTAGAHEIIFVDDGSSDESWAMILAIAAKSAEVRGISMVRNYGQHNALLAGIRAAGCEVIVTMDDDLQNPPEELPRMIDGLSRHRHSVIYGAPIKIHYGPTRGWATRISKYVIRRIIGLNFMENISAFRAFPATMRNAFVDYTGPFVDIDVLLSWATSNFVSVPVRHDQRKQGESGYTARKLLRHASDLVISYSVRPLQFASLLGFLLTLVGISIAIYAIVRYAVANTVPGFTFIASIVSLFSGTQLLVLGIFGEYLGRIHFRTLRKPSYVIDSVTPRNH